MEDTVYTTKSASETQELGKKIAQKFTEGGIICLYGDLGSGKTTFTQGFAQGLGVERRVNSPTFIIVRTYKVQSSKSKVNSFYHLDLYRINSDRDLEGLGVQEILQDKNNIIVIEWPEKIAAMLPKERTNMFFTYISENERRIEIKHD